MLLLNLEQKQHGSASFSLSGEFYDPDENKINMSLSGTSVTITEKVVTPPQTGGNVGGAGGTTSSGGTTNPGTTNQGTTTTKPSGTNQGSSTGSVSNNNSQANLSSNANLKTMQIGVEGISPAFNKNITEYFLVVDQTVESINVVATPEDSNATVSISGNQNLQIGSNKILITVTAQNKAREDIYNKCNKNRRYGSGKC